ncbi:MAG: hypothetical protein GY950_11755, partial [bacterium]|nr:hypothetical protein [bacterium]
TSLRDHIPGEKRGNYLSIGTDVLRNHLMSHINYTDKKKYIELVKLLIAKTYYIDAVEALVHRLIHTVEDFYRWLESYMLKLLEKEKPGVLGLSVYKDILPAAVYASRLTRRKYPHIKTVIGGSVFSEQLTVGSPDLAFFLEKTRDYIDKIIIGQGELLFLNYLQGNLPESQQLYTARDIAAQQLDLSQLPVPDYSDIEIDRYPYLGFTGSVSCPYQCSFCNVVAYFGQFKQKNPGQMVEEMLRLYDRYGRQVFYLSDNMVNPFIFELARECFSISNFLTGPEPLME